MRGERKNTQRMRRMAMTFAHPLRQLSPEMHGVHPTYILCPNIIPITNSHLWETQPFLLMRRRMPVKPATSAWPSLKA